MKKIVPAFFGCLLLAAPVAAQAQFSYTTNADRTLTITGYTGPGGAVTIPSNINGLVVTAVGESAFAGNDIYFNYSLTNVTIPFPVRSIGNEAFAFCANLASVSLPFSLTNIGGGAFEFCTGLTNITISCYDIIIGDGAFYKSGLRNLTISNGATSIGAMAFDYCGGLTSVIIPGSVQNIGVGAFENCRSLTDISIPASVTNIGFEAFGGFNNLTAITVDAQNLFYSSLNGVLFDKSKTTLIRYPGLLGSYTIPGSVTSIGENAFEYCVNLTSVTIPDSVTNIGNFAFFGCSGLTSFFFWRQRSRCGFICVPV